MSPANALLIFAKVPQPGRVKTRLLGTVSPQKAAEIHRASLEDTIELAARVPGCRKELFVAGSPREVARLAASLRLPPDWQVSVQRGRDLGARLHQAFASLFSAGCRKVVVIGTDTPWMGATRITQALRCLDTAQVVLGPTSDGGYYLVGARCLVPVMFRGIPWSTPQVLQRTQGALQKARVRFRLLPRDFDLDRPQDLARATQLLQGDQERAPALSRMLLGNRREKESGQVSKSSRRRAPARRNKKRRPDRG